MLVDVDLIVNILAIREAEYVLDLSTFQYRLTDLQGNIFISRLTIDVF